MGAPVSMPHSTVGPAAAGTEFLFEMERLVDVFGVLVAEHVVGAGHDTAGAAGAQPAGDDLAVEMLPVQLLGRHVRFLRTFPVCSVARGGEPVPSGPMTAVTVVLAHQGGWDEMLFVLVPLLVFLTLQWLNRRKMRQEGDDAQKPPSQ